jgi:predicted Na+-dependent transporter
MNAPHAVNLRNVLTLVGIVVTTLGVVFFATEFVDVISDWGRVISLVLLGVMFVALGVHFEQTSEGAAVASHSGWRWLKVNNALYILGAIAAFAAVIAFFAIDELARLWKVAVTIVLGLGLILVAARRLDRRPRD